MKRLPIYGLLLTGYIIIFVGINKLYQGLTHIDTIRIPAQEITVVKLDIIPAIILSVIIVLLIGSIVVFAVFAGWKYIMQHKIIIPILFFALILGIINLAVRIMESINVMITTNVAQFQENLLKYIQSFETLGTYFAIGIAVSALGIVYGVLLDKGLILNES